MADEQLIKPRELPAAVDVFPDDAIMTDDGVTVSKATPVQIVDAGAPVPTEAEAIAGTDNEKRMTPLTTKQVLDNVTAPSVLRAQAWAESPTTPDPALPGSKSAKSWANESMAAAEASATSARMWLYNSRSEMITATIPAWVNRTGFVTGVPTSKASTIWFTRKAGATVFADFAGWIPDGTATPDHFAENVTPGTTDMTVAMQSAVDAFQVVELLAARYRVSDTIVFSGRSPHFYGKGRGMGGVGSSMYGHAPTSIEWRGPENIPVLSYNPGDHDDVGIRWGGKFSNFSIYGRNTTGVIGIRGGAKTAQTTYQDIEITGVMRGFSIHQGAYANLFLNCIVSDFTENAWLLRGGNHNAKFFGCATNYNSGNAAANSVYVRGEEGGGSTAVSFIGCDFDAFDQSTVLRLERASGVEVSGCYFEARSASTQQFIRVGVTGGSPGVYSGLSITGCEVAGHSFARELIYVTGGASGINISSNHIWGLTGSVVNNAEPGTQNTLGSNWVSSTPALFFGGRNGWTGVGHLRQNSQISITSETEILDYTHYLKDRLRLRRISADLRLTCEDILETNVIASVRLQKFNGTIWENFGDPASVNLFVNAGTRGLTSQTLNLTEVDSSYSSLARYRVLISPGTNDTVIVRVGSSIRVEEIDA